jgi:hypothetical protein
MSIEDYQKAAQDKDIELAMSTCADNVVFRSPITGRHPFEGKDAIRALFAVVYEEFDRLDYHTVVGGRLLVGNATVGGQPLEAAHLLTFDEDDKITEITLFVRPLPGLTALMAALGPALALQNGRSRLTAGLLKVMAAPLVAATRFGDRFGVRLALPKRRVSA